MASFALYRLPHADRCVYTEQTDGEPVELLSCAELNGRSGFVVAPFEATPRQPILLIRADRVEEAPVSQLPQLPIPPLSPVAPISPSRSHYAVDFANFHAQLQSGVFAKIVLARCATVANDHALSPLQLFSRACQLYPRLFVALCYTPKSGLWLTATPEILLEGRADQWRTVALAGTMKLEGDQLAFDTAAPFNADSITWSQKNIQEQRIVATYITEQLERFTSRFREEGPRTVRAANLVHLRSDFTFTLPDADHVGDLLQALHPTPAVCGLPKREAFDFIVRNEQTPRRYYSGFMGPLRCPASDTSLYVSLRCMNIARDTYYLYAGGGLLPDSREELEWQETEAKLETMRALLII